MNINDVTFAPNVPKEALEVANQWFEDNQSKFHTTANYAIIGEKGEITLQRIADSCHYSIGNPGTSDRCLIVTENGYSRRMSPNNKYSNKPKNSNYCFNFLDWLLNESFAGRFILNRDNWDQCLNKGFILSADTNHLLLQNILILTRHFWEISEDRFKLFDELSEVVERNFAYGLAFNTTLADPMNAITADYTHKAFKFWPNVKTMTNFLNGDFGKTLSNSSSKHYRTARGITGGANFCWEGMAEKVNVYNYTPLPVFTDELLKNEDFKKRLQDFRKDVQEREGIKVVNPFTSKVLARKPEWISREETFAVLIPYLLDVGLVKPAMQSSEEINMVMKEVVNG